MSQTDAEPEPALPGLVNLRDLGGTPTGDGRTIPPGRLLRGAEPVGLDAGELRTLEQLGVASRLDLRAVDEPEASPCEELDAAGIVSYHVPFVELSAAPDILNVDTDEALGRRYVHTARSNAANLQTALELLADDAPLGVLVHCAWGKDRAGIMTAAVLDLLDVPRERIVADYVRTEHAVEDLLERALAPLPSSQIAAARVRVQGRPIVHAREATITTYLDDLDAEAGGIRGLLSDHGTDVAELSDALRGRLLG